MPLDERLVRRVHAELHVKMMAFLLGALPSTLAVVEARRSAEVGRRGALVHPGTFDKV